MKHIFLKGENDLTFVLLHGTGVDENDLIPLAKDLDENANILSVRGNIVDGDGYRFFKRITMDKIDYESLRVETENLKKFILQAKEGYGLTNTKIIALGFSNGSNIATNILFNYENVFDYAMLLHPIFITDKVNVKKICPVFMSAGANDPLTTLEKTKKIEDIFSKYSVDLEANYYNFGHYICEEEFIDIKNWLYKTFNK